MSTTRTFNAMLNEYLTNDLLMEEYIKRDYVLNKIEKRNDWKGGTMPVPFKSQGASSVKFGALTSSTDISETKYIRGTISSYTEVWGSMIFNHRDLQEHNGKIPESTFLRILPGQVEDFMQYMKEVASIQMTGGPHFAKSTADTDLANGKIAVDHIDRFYLDQKCTLDDDNSSPTDVYVIAINVNTKDVTFSATRGGAAASLTAYTLAQNAKFYYDGVWDGTTATTFVSMRRAFLSLANGGDASLHGTTKLSYPFLQAVNVDGSSVNAANILDKLFDGYTTVRNSGKGNANTILCSFKHLGSIMKLVETQKGPFSVTKQPSASLYGWTEIEITSVKGALTIVGLLEMDDDVIFYVDWSSMMFASNGFFKKRVSPDGIEYFEQRATTGYSYIVDISLFGEMVHLKVGQNGVMYGIPAYS